jgi:hypothetical protein
MLPIAWAAGQWDTAHEMGWHQGTKKKVKI